MGTRSLTIVKLNGEVKVAQYCQWDGYFRGQGTVIAKFIQNELDLRKFKKNIKSLKWASSKEIDDLYIKAGSKNGMISFDDADKVKNSNPEFHRDTGALILKLIQDGKVKKVQNDITFLKDTLFCDYAYEIDLNKKVINIYTGKKNPSFTIKFKDFTVKKMLELENSL